MTNRINMASEVPSMYKKLFDMEQEGKELIQNAQIEEGFPIYLN